MALDLRPRIPTLPPFSLRPTIEQLKKLQLPFPGLLSLPQGSYKTFCSEVRLSFFFFALWPKWIFRFFAGFKIFPQRFRRHVYIRDQSIVTNTWSDAWHITVALHAQQRCAQTISANVLKKNLKIGLSSVGKMYVVCALFRNALTCLYWNQSSTFFELDPPLSKSILFEHYMIVISWQLTCSSKEIRKTWVQPYTDIWLFSFTEGCSNLCQLHGYNLCWARMNKLVLLLLNVECQVLHGCHRHRFLRFPDFFLTIS